MFIGIGAGEGDWKPLLHGLPMLVTGDEKVGVTLPLKEVTFIVGSPTQLVFIVKRGRILPFPLP